MDVTSKDILTDQKIDMDDDWFEMSESQMRHFTKVSDDYQNIRNDYHSLHSDLWLSQDQVPRSVGPRLVRQYRS